MGDKRKREKKSMIAVKGNLRSTKVIIMRGSWKEKKGVEQEGNERVIIPMMGKEKETKSTGTDREYLEYAKLYLYLELIDRKVWSYCSVTLVFLNVICKVFFRVHFWKRIGSCCS